MPRPSKIPDIWSQADNYSVGPKAGQPTKTAIGNPVAEALEGHFPGKDFPTTSNGFNRWCRDMSESVNWLHEARTDRQVSSHIVETDANGKVSGASAHFGGTTAAGPSLLVEENNGGDSLQVGASNNVAVRVTTLMSANSTAESLTIANESHGNVGYIGSMLATNPGGTQSSGGLSASVSTDLVESGFDYVSAIRGYNANGVAGTFRADNAGGDAFKVINEGNEGVALRAGFSSQENNGKGCAAIEAEGGDGQNTGVHIPGGVGVFTQGGYGEDTGGNESTGGLGLFAIGGDAETSGNQGAGALIQPGGNAVPALVVDALHSSYFSDLAYLQILDGAGTGLQIDVDRGFGAIINAHDESGLLINMSNNGTGLDAALTMSPQNEPTSTQDGALWVENHPTHIGKELRVDLGNKYDVARYDDWCRAVGDEVSGPTVTSGGGDEAGVSASFGSRDEPSDASDVIIELSFRADLPGSGATNSILQVKLIDQTDSDAVIDIRTEYLRRNADTVDGYHRVMKFPYTLPANGGRIFRADYSVFGSGVDITVSRQMLEVRPR